jgi:putative peptide zinc metalloprotease protein
VPLLDGAGAPNGREPALAEPTAGASSRPREDVPLRADGVQLLGSVPGSGYRRPPALVRRSDGQTIQLTPLLYAVLEQVDGVRSWTEVAEAVGAAVRRPVTADDVRVLGDTKLRPLGLLRRGDGSEPEVKRSNPLLALRFRYVVSDPDVTRRVTAPFAVLFAPVVVAVLVLAFLIVCWWVLWREGLAAATHEAFDRPLLLLAVFAVTVVSAGFHEFGHAAAARYGGATPGAMGTGLYLVWPAFYTDVTDSYRLGRAGRVRTDLGGLYFNAIVAVAMFGAWWVTGYDAVLLIIATQVLQMVRQLVPLVRFDGYHVLADLTGVPDLYQRIRPTLVGLLPGHWNDPESRVLKPWARAVVTGWVVVVVPVLLLCLVTMVLTFPRVAGTAWASLRDQTDLLGVQVGEGDVAAVLVRVLSIVAIGLPVVSIAYIVGRIVRRVVATTWQRTDGRPVQRAAAGIVAAALVAGVAWAWWPADGTYRPIQAYERGSLRDAVDTVLPGVASRGLQEGRQGAGRAVWPADSPLPTADRPQLAVVMVPRTGGAPQGDGRAAAEPEPPTWVFPFDRPLPPGDGDNQAMAVNTTDGATRYDVAFALVWADDRAVTNANEAYALASCTGCRTVAVAFQVVLVVGQANVVVPENVAVAVNYACVQCVTQALATQLVVTLSGPLGEESMARLAALWEEIAAFGETIDDIPLSEVRSRLTEYEARILEVLGADPAARTPTGGTATSPPTPTTSGSSGGPSGSATSPVDGATATGGPTSATSPGTSSTPPTTSSGGSASPTTTPSTVAPAPTTTADDGVAESTPAP